jgi:hypothetical protein
MEVSKYNQMMSYLTRPRERFQKGKKVTGKFKIDPTASKDKQVLVQEGIYFKPKSGNFVVQLARGPGIKTTVGVGGETMKTLGAAKKRLAVFEKEFPKTIAKIANPPKGSEKFLKGWMADRGVSKWEDLTKQQKESFVRTTWPNVQKQSKLIANKIPASEMAELLGIDKSVLDNSRKRGGIFAKEIERVLGKPVNLVGKAGGTLGERGEYIYYDKPTSAQIKSLKTYIPKTFGQLTQDVTNRVRILADDTEFMNDLKKIKTVDDVDKLKMLQKYTNKYPELNLSSGKLARATLLISQVAGGNAEYRGLDNIKPDKVLSKRLNNMIENAPFGNVYKKEAYDLAMRNIDQQFGSETATFSKYRDKIKSEFKRLGFKDFKKFNLDEYVGTSIGGFKGAGQYSVFSRLLAQDVNQKSGASYLGRLSQATDDLEAALAANDKRLADEIVEKNMADALRTSKKTKNSLPYLSLEPPGSKKNFGVKRLNQLEAQGLDFKKFYKERRFGFSGLKEAMTQKEIISKLGGLETGSLKGQDASLAQSLAILGCGSDRLRSQAGGTPTRECVLAGANKINNPSLIKGGAEARNASQFLNRAYKLGRNVVKFGVIPEAIFVAGESLVRMGLGDTLSESLLKATDYLLPGNQTRKADQLKFDRTLDKETSDIILKARDYKDSINQLNTAKSNLETNQAVLDGSDFGYTGNVDLLKRQELDEQIIKLKEQNVKNKYVPEAVTAFATVKEAEAQDIASSNSPILKAIQNAKSAQTDDFEQLFAPEKKQEGVAPPMLTMDDIADIAITDTQLQRAKDELGGAPEYTKRNILDFRRQTNKEYNDAVLSLIFAEGEKNLANRERLFGTQSLFGGAPIIDTPNRGQSSYIQSPFQREEENRLIEEGARFGAAGGGIMKLAGIDKGPQITSMNPDSGGLASLRKNVKKL